MADDGNRTRLLIRHSVPVLLEPTSQTSRFTDPIYLFFLTHHPAFTAGNIDQPIIILVKTGESVQDLLLRVQLQ
jgi:hypothetical protein